MGRLYFTVQYISLFSIFLFPRGTLGTSDNKIIKRLVHSVYCLFESFVSVVWPIDGCVGGRYEMLECVPGHHSHTGPGHRGSQAVCGGRIHYVPEVNFRRVPLLHRRVDRML